MLIVCYIVCGLVSNRVQKKETVRKKFEYDYLYCDYIREHPCSRKYMLMYLGVKGHVYNLFSKVSGIHTHTHTH